MYEALIAAMWVKCTEEEVTNAKARKKRQRLRWAMFDANLNEYHIVRGPKDILMIYNCPFCGGSAPKSKRSLLFHTLTNAERQLLCRQPAERDIFGS